MGKFVFRAILLDVDSDGNPRGEVHLGEGATAYECVQILTRYCATHGVVLDLSGEVVFDVRTGWGW